jgi:hypothetical protein
LLGLTLVLALLLPFAVLFVRARLMAPLAPVPAPSGIDRLDLGKWRCARQWQEPQQGYQAAAGAGSGECTREAVNGNSIHRLVLQDDPQDESTPSLTASPPVRSG